MLIEVTKRAEQDIIEHYLYGLMQFGKRQADEYEENLRHVYSLIGENPSMANERSEYRPPVRVHHTGKHYIVYRILAQRVLILRILRDEADLSRHL